MYSCSLSLYVTAFALSLLNENPANSRILVIVMYHL